MSIFEKVNFALVTSDSLMEKVPSWSSYVSMEEPQFLDLINYSKELVDSEGDHKITFLVVAQGEDEVEAQEAAQQQEAVETIEKIKEKEEAASKRAADLRTKSKSILNSIYGV